MPLIESPTQYNPLDKIKIYKNDVLQGTILRKLNFNNDFNITLDESTKSFDISIGGATLDSLSDVIITNPQIAEVPRYNGTHFVNSLLALDDLSDALITTPFARQVLRHNGTQFVNQQLTLPDLGDTVIASPSNRHFMVHNGTNWTNLLPILNDLFDVVVSTPVLDQILYFNGNNWINAGLSLNSLSNVLITNPISGHVLKFSGGQWSNAAQSTFDLENFGGAITSKSKLPSSIAYEDEANVFIQQNKITVDNQEPLIIHRASSTGELVLSLRRNNSIGTEKEYARFQVTTLSGADGNESADIRLRSIRAGIITTNLLLQETALNFPGSGSIGFRLATTGLTSIRTFTFPNADGEIATRNNGNSFTAKQTIEASSNELLDLYRSSSTVGNSVDLSIYHNNASGTKRRLSAITSILLDNSANIENTSLNLWVQKSGSFLRALSINYLGQLIIRGSNTGPQEFILSPSGLTAPRTFTFPNSSGELALSSDAGSTTLNGLTDVDIASPSNDQVLTYETASSLWKNKTSPAGVTTLGGLTDVDITSPVEGHIVRHNGTQFVNIALAELIALTQLSDVAITSPQTGDHLEYDGAGWVNAAVGSGAAAREDLCAHFGPCGRNNPGTSYSDLEYIHAAAGTFTTKAITSIDFTGKTEYRILINLRKAGSTTFHVRVVDDSSTSNVLHEFSSITQTTTDSGLVSIPGWATGVKTIRLQGRTGNSDDDIGIPHCSVYLK